MRIKTIGQRIQIKPDKVHVGTLETETIDSAQEMAEVIDIGEKVTLPIKVGDKIAYKSWAVDIVGIGGKNYYFISEQTDGICGIIKSK